MFSVILQTFLLYLPAILVDAFPIFFDRYGWWKFLAVPVDFGYKIGEDFIFGSHKTYRGIVVGVLGGCFIAALELMIISQFPDFFVDTFFGRGIYFTPFGFLFWGGLIGFGALIGDLVKSFFKRRLHIPSGASFLLFDQIDSLIGALAFGSFMYFPSWSALLFLFFITPLLHFGANVVAYFCGLKKVWW